jgi:hypothetical protein
LGWTRNPAGRPARVRLADTCRVWAACPRVALPLAMPAAADDGGGELPLRRAA